MEWDPAKERANRARHGLGFDAVRVLFEGRQDYLVIYDEEHGEDEDRFIAIGLVPRGVVVVVHTEPRDDVIRIISARLATPTERDLFHQHPKGRKQ